MNPEGQILPCPQPPLPRAGWGPGTYHSWAILARGRQGRQRGAAAGVVQERGGGTARAHSSVLKGLLLLQEEAANGEDKAEVR